MFVLGRDLTPVSLFSLFSIFASTYDEVGITILLEETW